MNKTLNVLNRLSVYTCFCVTEANLWNTIQMSHVKMLVCLL